ncbi:MAG: S1 RNA-binding domain-containing protein [Lachnospiraceae bacterium]|nr:S1 RNA-binding domain-containing protein [Lachnospiraceae bacterium]
MEEMNVTNETIEEIAAADSAVDTQATEEAPAAEAAPAEAPAEEAPEAAPVEAPAEEAPAETMADYAGEIDSSMRDIKVGDILEGTVVGVTDTEVTVDLSYAAEGIIRAKDYSAEQGFSIKNDVHPGDEVKAVVVKLDDGNGNILLSRRQATETLAWQKFEDLLAEKRAIEVTVKEAVKGGVVTFINGIRAFIPASKLSLDYVEDLTTFVGQTIPARIIQAEREGKKLILSSRDVLRERRSEAKAARKAAIKEGAVLDGKVDSLQSYGAFVSLGDGIDGLVHISQITNTKRLNHPKEMLSVGDEVKVKVIGVKDGKISLSMKALAEVPEETKQPAARETGRKGDKERSTGRDRDQEEKVEIPKTEELTTSLGDLLKGIKLD